MKRRLCKLEKLLDAKCKELKELKNQIPKITVDRKVLRCVYEYDIAFDGEIMATRGGDAPTPIVAANPGQPYTLTFPTALANPSIHVEVTANVGSGDSTGHLDNAFIEQAVRFNSPTIAQFGLYSGDDGGGLDDDSRRAVTVFIHEDKELICQLYINGQPVASG